MLIQIGCNLARLLPVPSHRRSFFVDSSAAGNRWHIDCFRCNTCGTLLDSDANLLLLGDGSLICNNCTYSCSACGNKIEDLAILTGEQAFCASCFKCRNCKRQIENLRYARTSQGIFCMACHESLMARRRKKSKASRQHTATLNGAAANVFDKSLPALPPNAALLPAELETPPSDGQIDTPSDMSPAQGPKPRLRSKKEASTLNLKREAEPSEAIRKGMTTDPKCFRLYLECVLHLTLPQTTHHPPLLTIVDIHT